MAGRRSILLIEDSESDRSLARTVLQREGFEVFEAGTGERGFGMVERLQPDLVLLDIMLPGIDGLEVCRGLRARYLVPVIVLSAREDETDKVVALESGADDYLTKPYSPRELAARVKAVLRRAVSTARALAQRKWITYPGFEIDLSTRSVKVHGEPVHLTPKEFDILFHLASQPRRVVTREEIAQAVWTGSTLSGEMRSIDTLVKRLRGKLEGRHGAPWRIATVWGVGYRFEASE